MSARLLDNPALSSLPCYRCLDRPVVGLEVNKRKS